MSNKPVSEALKKLLADYYMLYLKTQSYHWNVESQNFHGLHMQFEEQYKNLAEAIDTVAEHIRGLGEKAPGTFEAYAKSTSLKPGNENASAKEMLHDVLADHETILKSLQNTLEICQKDGDEVVAGFIVERMAYHRKTIWMLKSSQK